MAHERNRDVENLLARAADRTRNARAELSGAAHDLFLPAERRLTDQQRALMGDLLTKLVAGIELILRQQVSETVDGVGGDATSIAYPALEAIGALHDPALLRLVMQRAEEHRLALVAADSAFDAAAGANLLEALARNPDPELARRAVAYVVAEARRSDRFRDPLLLNDDLPAPVAYRLHWQVAAALRHHLLAQHGVAASALDRALEAAVRQAMADHSDGQGSYARAARLAARLHEMGELGDEFLVRALSQGHLALFAGGLSVRAALGVDVVWQAIADRGRHSLLVLLRAIDMSAAAAASIVELLEAGQPLARPPSAQRALIAAYEAIDRADAQRLLRNWQLDPGFREAIDDLDAGARR